MSKRTVSYNDEFKKQAVELLLSSQKPLIQVCRELGVSTTSLRSWKRRAMVHGKNTVPPPKDDSVEELQRVNCQLREELAFKDRACEILKKAIAICSEQQGIKRIML